MAYSNDKKPGELTALTTLATDDVFVVGDTSDASEVAKGITKANLITDLTTSFATAGHNHTGVYAPALGADDNYVTDAEKAALHSHSNKTVLDNTTASFTTAQETKLSGIEVSADVTDATNVAAAGAIMDGDFSTNGLMKRTGAGSYATAAAGTDYAAALGADDNYVTDAEKTKLSNLSGTNTGDQDLSALAPKASPTFTGTVTLPTGLTGVLRADAGVVSTDSDVTDLVTAASDTASGKVELAIASEVNTGTDTSRAVTADALAGSYAGTKSWIVDVIEATTDLTTGDNKYSFVIPSSLNGMDLIAAHARVFTAGTTGTTDIQLHNVTDAVDILTTKITIDSTETTSYTAATAPVINTSNDSLATGDIIRVDIDAISTTAPKGLQVILEARLP